MLFTLLVCCCTVQPSAGRLNLKGIGRSGKQQAARVTTLTTPPRHHSTTPPLTTPPLHHSTTPPLPSPLPFRRERLHRNAGRRAAHSPSHHHHHLLHHPPTSPLPYLPFTFCVQRSATAGRSGTTFSSAGVAVSRRRRNDPFPRNRVSSTAVGRVLLSTTGRARSAGGDSPGALALAPPPPIHLFSTVRPFSWYIANCDEFAPHLAARGVFKQLYLKFPPFALLQRAVVEYKLIGQLPDAPEEALLRAGGLVTRANDEDATPRNSFTSLEVPPDPELPTPPLGVPERAHQAAQRPQELPPPRRPSGGDLTLVA